MAGDQPDRDAFRKAYLHGDNPFGDNPYASPSLQDDAPPDGPAEPLPRASGRGMVGHVSVVAILMIVQGALEVVMGLALAGTAAFMTFVMRSDPKLQQAPPPGVSPDVMAWFMLAMYGGMALVTLVAAALHIRAGIRNYKFRSRTLGLVSLAGGMVTVLTCYCAPTAIALGVYGLVTYLNPEVTQAFAMGEAGRKREEILAVFGA